MDIEKARFNMVEQQIRPWEVLDPDVLSLLFRVRREDFVPQAYQALAFADLEIPLGQGDFMWPPRLEARVLQALQVGRHERVLEVGTGSGYFTALLAAQAGWVVSVDLRADLLDSAREKFKAHGLTHVETRVGDAAQDWSADGTFDVIVLTGSSPCMPEAYVQRLRPGGRLFAIVGEAPAMQARLVTCVQPGVCRTETLFETVVKPLAHALEPERFVF